MRGFFLRTPSPMASSMSTSSTPGGSLQSKWYMNCSSVSSMRFEWKVQFGKNTYEGRTFLESQWVGFVPLPVDGCRIDSSANVETAL